RCRRRLFCRPLRGGGGYPMTGARRRVWVNLQRGDLSIGDASGRVVTNVDDVTMVDVEFRASKAGWARIHRLGKRRRGVAYAVGRVVAVNSAPSVDGMELVTYNPWRRDDFHTLDGRSVTAADRVIFIKGHAYTFGEI